MNQIATATRMAPRRPWRAFLLSFILPGLGQLYNGDVNKAAWFFLLFAFFSVPAVGFLVLYLPPELTVHAMLGTFGLSLLVWLIGLVDAWRSASRKQEYVTQAWQGMGAYLLVFAVCILIALPLMTQYVRSKMIEPFRIPSSSMEPTLVAGDFIYADKRYNCRGCPHKVARGDIAIFIYPNDRTTNYIKRVIGLPGDRITIKDQVVSVNGTPLSGKPQVQGGLLTVQERYEQASWLVVWKEPGKRLPPTNLTVPQGQVFVLGDNRTNSNDSRFFGTVPLDDVIGKARQIWLSYNGSLGGLVLQRSGLVVR